MSFVEQLIKIALLLIDVIKNKYFTVKPCDYYRHILNEGLFPYADYFVLKNQLGVTNDIYGYYHVVRREFNRAVIDAETYRGLSRGRGENSDQYLEHFIRLDKGYNNSALDPLALVNLSPSEMIIYQKFGISRMAFRVGFESRRLSAKTFEMRTSEPVDRFWLTDFFEENNEGLIRRIPRFPEYITNLQNRHGYSYKRDVLGDQLRQCDITYIEGIDSVSRTPGIRESLTIETSRLGYPQMPDRELTFANIKEDLSFYINDVQPAIEYTLNEVLNLSYMF